MNGERHVRAIAKLAAERIEAGPRLRARTLGDPSLAIALGVQTLVEEARDQHLALLDADEGLTVLCIPWEDLLAETAALLRRPRTHCSRCGARLPRRRPVCSRCHLAGT